jgi:hypothetical protein
MYYVFYLCQELNRELAFHICKGKGSKAGLIPYGEFDWGLVIIDQMLEAAGIGIGPVFRGIYKGGQTLRPGWLTLRAVEYIVGSYPVSFNGKMIK